MQQPELLHRGEVSSCIPSRTHVLHSPCEPMCDGLLACAPFHPQAMELDYESDGSAIQNAIASAYGQRTVPAVFINGQFIGGCDGECRGSLRTVVGCAQWLSYTVTIGAQAITRLHPSRRWVSWYWFDCWRCDLHEGVVALKCFCTCL